MHLHKIFRPTLTALALCCSLCFVQAQPPGDPGDPGGDPGGGDVGVPVDGGLTLLIISAVGYAAKKRYDKRKQQARKLIIHSEEEQASL